MARCGECNKFVSFEEQDPEVESVEYAGGVVSVSVRIVNACADCGSDLREATLEMSGEAPEGWDKHDPDQDGADEETHDLEADEEESERTSRQDGKPGTPSRYRRTYYGAKVSARLRCKCGEYDEVVDLEDDIQAGQMDEL